MGREDEGVEGNPAENPPLATVPYIRPEDWKLSGSRTRLSRIRRRGRGRGEREAMVTTSRSRRRAEVKRARKPHGGYRILPRIPNGKGPGRWEEPGSKPARPLTPGNRGWEEKSRW